jgi:hypothetical protein
LGVNTASGAFCFPGKKRAGIPPGYLLIGLDPPALQAHTPAGKNFYFWGEVSQRERQVPHPQRLIITC